MAYDAQYNALTKTLELQLNLSYPIRKRSFPSQSYGTDGSPIPYFDYATFKKDTEHLFGTKGDDRWRIGRLRIHFKYINQEYTFLLLQKLSILLTAFLLLETLIF